MSRAEKRPILISHHIIATKVRRTIVPVPVHSHISPLTERNTHITKSDMKRHFTYYFLASAALGQAGAFTPPAVRKFITPTPLRSLSHDNSIEEYSSSLTPRQERDQIKEELGFKVDSTLKKVIKKPLRTIRKFAKRALAGKKQPGALILVRGGESEFSKNFTWTGWSDPPLTPAGYLQVCLSSSCFTVFTEYRCHQVVLILIFVSAHFVTI